jgi:hypothetical protein
VIVLPVVKLGVTPLPVTILGDILPLYSILPAPLTLIPTEKKVAVPDPPVPAGKVIAATGEVLCADATVHPGELVERTTATLA